MEKEMKKIHYASKYEYRIIKQAHRDSKKDYYDAQYRLKNSDEKWMGMNYLRHDFEESIKAVRQAMENDYGINPMETVEIEFAINGSKYPKKNHWATKYEYRIIEQIYYKAKNNLKDMNRIFPQFREKNSNAQWQKAGDKWTYTIEESIELVEKRIENDKEQYPVEIAEVDFAVDQI